MDLLQRGRERYTIYCAVCHGQGGYGDGTVALRAAEIQAANGDAAGWVAPKNYHTDDMRQQPVGKIYNTIANGVRTHAGLRQADFRPRPLGHRGLREGLAAEPGCEGRGYSGSGKRQVK